MIFLQYVQVAMADRMTWRQSRFECICRFTREMVFGLVAWQPISFPTNFRHQYDFVIPFPTRSATNAVQRVNKNNDLDWNI